MPFSFMSSLFMDIRIYAFPNAGRLYDFGEPLFIDFRTYAAGLKAPFFCWQLSIHRGHSAVN
jgi:hypothetical protein